MRRVLVWGLATLAVAFGLLVPVAWADSNGRSPGATEAHRGGSQTVQAQSSKHIPYDSNAPRARRAGSGQGGVEEKVGFKCRGKMLWAIVQGTVQCADKLTLAGGASGLLDGGKTLFVRANLVDGFVSGVLMRLTGTELELRVDMFGIDGRVTSSCFVTAAQPSCHQGSPNEANPGLDSLAQFTNAAGALRYASELVGGNEVFASSLVGGALKDAYIASVSVSQAHLDVQVAGVYFLDGSQGTSRMRPVYTSGRMSWATFAGATAQSNEMVWALGTGWAANTPN